MSSEIDLILIIWSWLGAEPNNGLQGQPRIE